MFRNAYRLPFRLLGIPLDLDLSFLIIVPVLAWMIANNLDAYVESFGLDLDPVELRASLPPFALGLIAALGLFASVLIHELGHSVVGRYYGMEITSITLWLLGGMAKFKEISKRPGVEAIMAIAGPLTSYALGGICWLALQALPSGPPALRFILSYLFWMNIILATFNLLPAFPLDGGRVLRSLLALKMGQLRATRIAAGVGRMLALFLGILGLVTFHIFLLLVAFFVFMAGASEAQHETFSSMLQGVRVRDVMSTAVKTVIPSTRVRDLLERMFEEKHLAYPVIDDRSVVVGIVTLRELELESAGDAGSLEVGQVMSPCQTIEAEATALQAFETIMQHSSGRLVVVDGAGHLVGIVSKTDLVQAVQIRLVEEKITRK